jgi:hypothetical protein
MPCISRQLPWGVLKLDRRVVQRGVIAGLLSVEARASVIFRRRSGVVKHGHNKPTKCGEAPLPSCPVIKKPNGQIRRVAIDLSPSSGKVTAIFKHNTRGRKMKGPGERTLTGDGSRKGRVTVKITS